MHKCNIEQVVTSSNSAVFGDLEIGDVKFGNIKIDLRWSHIDNFSKADLSRFEDLITSIERARVRAAKTEMVRKTRLVARALLREELGRKTGIPASHLPLQLSPGGKPHLSSSTNSPVQFSLAYSQGWIVHAFTNKLEIGVDLEAININHITRELVQDMMTKDEQAIMAALPETKRAAKFFEFWTIKESVLKAAGVGFSGLDDLTVENSASFLCLGQSWKWNPLTAPAGFVATVAWRNNA